MRNRSERDAMSDSLNDLAVMIDQIGSLPAPEKAKARKLLVKKIHGQTERLHEIAVSLDPILRPTKIFDPTSPKTAGQIVALTLVAQPKHQLERLRPFYGAGIYAIYYRGDFPAYIPLSGTEQPLYIGKAEPTDRSAKNALDQGVALHKRLMEHGGSIARATSSLNVDDFECRFLIVQTGYQRAAEEYLIKFFQPIWNSETKICFGLGKHGDDAATRGNRRSPWDTLHPGRLWANAISEDQKPRQQILDEITTHFTAFPPPGSVDAILRTFLSDLEQLSPPDFETNSNQVVDIEDEAY